MPNRPAIPIAIVREVLFEARHRCAVCCEPTPLERAHIRAWNKSRDHSAVNLIALCPNCHTRADAEDWGESVLRRYKETPCALEKHRTLPASAEQKALVEFILATHPDAMNATERVRFASMAAAYVGVSFTDIRVISVSLANSSRVLVEMPLSASLKLMAAFKAHDNRLQEFLSEFCGADGLLAINIVDGKVAEYTTVLASDSIARGELRSCGSIDIKGRMFGGISSSQTVRISNGGHYDGRVAALHVVVHGSLEGNIDTELSTHVARTGSIVGDVRAASMTIDDGAVIDGYVTAGAYQRVEGSQRRSARIAEAIPTSERHVVDA